MKYTMHSLRSRSLSIAGLLLTTLLLSAAGFLQSPLPQPGWNFNVRDALGAPVQGATVCIGTGYFLAEYGSAGTNAAGDATVSSPYGGSPSIDGPFYVVASKNGYGVAHYFENPGPVPIDGMNMELQLPGSPSEWVCPDDGGTWDFAIQVDPENLMAGEIFDLLFTLDRPPPFPTPVTLESSHPDLIPLPREVTFRRGEQKKVLKVQVGRRVSRATSVGIRAVLGKDSRQKKQITVLVRPGDGGGDGPRKRRN